MAIVRNEPTKREIRVRVLAYLQNRFEQLDSCFGDSDVAFYREKVAEVRELARLMTRAL